MGLLSHRRVGFWDKDEVDVKANISFGDLSVSERDDSVENTEMSMVL